MTCVKLRHVVIAAFLFISTVLVAQDAKVKVQVSPSDASIFVDGRPYKHSAGVLELAPGEHTIGAYNYGYTPQVQKVTLKEGENPELSMKLETMSGDVQGPWGNLQIKGISGSDFVFLNGKSPEFFVGRVDEMKGNRIVLPPGLQHVIIVNPDGNRQVYSGYVKIVANKRATLHVDKSDTYYESWVDGGQLHALPRVGPTTVAIEPVSGQVAAYPAVANCGQPVKLVWTSNGYYTMLKMDHVAIGEGGGSGEQMVDPKKTTTYQLEAFGPGGVSITPVTVQVDNSVHTTLTTTPAVVRYHKIGDNVLDPGTATLNWTATNATSVVIDPFGAVTGTSGERDITLAPTKTDVGPVEEVRAYKIIATNDCGGSDTSTALVQVAGSIDPPIDVLPPVLPQTGSPLPLIALIGLGSLASSFAVRKIRKGYSSRNSG